MLKPLLEQALVSSGVASVAQKRRAGSTLVLAYHNVVATADASRGDASLHLAIEQFVDHLRLLERHADIVALDDLASSTRGDRVRVAITFDDAYAGALALAIPELVRRRLPATIFVAPGLLGAAGTWWDRFIVSTAADAERVRDQALTTLRGEAAKIEAHMTSRGIAPATLPASFAIAGEAQLSEVARLPGITLGCHTWDHPSLAALEEVEIRSQIQRSIQWLAQFPASRSWIAYPYGHESPTVRKICRELGLTLGFRVSGGFLAQADDPLGLPRYNVPAGLSNNGFRLRLAGLLTER